jgi:hypothetical protein
MSLATVARGPARTQQAIVEAERLQFFAGAERRGRGHDN